MSKKIMVRDPENAVEAYTSWADMPSDRRKLRAYKADNEDDRDELHGLLDCYITGYTKSRERTSPRTRSAYWAGSTRLLDYCASKGLKPHSMNNEDVTGFIVSMNGLSGKTQTLYLSGAKTMIAAIRWACKIEGPDPFILNGRAVSVHDPNAGTIKADPYMIDEMRKLLDGADERERAVILLGADCGLRLAEMVSLKWSGVDAERKLLKFIGKGSKKAKVNATSRCIDALNALPREGDKVFGIGRSRLQQLFAKRCQDAGIKGRGIHDLRHCCGTRLYAATRDLLVVKRHLRHSSTTTSELYATLADEDFLAAVKKLESNGYS